MEAELLHMDPKSQEAQVFYQLEKGSSKNGTSPAPSSSGNEIDFKLWLLVKQEHV